MEFDQVVRTRRSVREFAHSPVSDETVKALIECALHAPSSMNGQPWRFIIVRDAKTKQAIADMKDSHCPPEKRHFSAQFLATAPVIIVTCVAKAESFDRGLESGILATSHLQLAAASRGLTSVYLSAYMQGKPKVAEDVRKILSIPSEYDPITIVPIGVPAETPGPKTIKSVAEVTFREAFGRK